MQEIGDLTFISFLYGIPITYGKLSWMHAPAASCFVEMKASFYTGVYLLDFTPWLDFTP